LPPPSVEGSSFPFQRRVARVPLRFQFRKGILFSPRVKSPLLFFFSWRGALQAIVSLLPRGPMAFLPSRDLRTCFFLHAFTDRSPFFFFFPSVAIFFLRLSPFSGRLLSVGGYSLPSFPITWRRRFFRRTGKNPFFWRRNLCFLSSLRKSWLLPVAPCIGATASFSFCEEVKSSVFLSGVKLAPV